MLATPRSIIALAAASAAHRCAVLLTATPGVRRGRDHGLREAAELVGRFLPGTRLVYSGSSAVYADAGGAGVDERAPLRHDDAACAALIAIEQAVAGQPGALTLRVPALVGPSRGHARARLAEAARARLPLAIGGDLARPFSYLHEQDLCELLVSAALGGLGCGVLNAAAPQPLTVGGYYRLLAQDMGLEVALAGDGSAQPRRWIDAAVLHALVSLAAAGPAVALSAQMRGDGALEQRHQRAQPCAHARARQHVADGLAQGGRGLAHGAATGCPAAASRGRCRRRPPPTPPRAGCRGSGASWTRPQPLVIAVGRISRRSGWLITTWKRVRKRSWRWARAESTACGSSAYIIFRLSPRQVSWRSARTWIGAR